MKRFLLAAGALGTSAAAYAFAFTPWQRRWGATPDEIARPMLGDDIVPDADLVSTRAITAYTQPRDIWPWLAQMGYRRGGLYSYDALDMAFGILDRPSSKVILPEHQDLNAGDVIPIGAGGNFYVHLALPGECLVIGPEDTSIPVSWATSLYPESGGTRLVTRVRVRSSGMPGGALANVALDLAGFIMVRRWLQVLKERAEGLALARAQATSHLKVV